MLLKLPFLLHPVAPAAVADHVLYNLILTGTGFVLAKSAAAYTTFSIILLLGQAFYLSHICSKHKMYPKSGYLPAVMYLMLTSVAPNLNYFGETLIVNWILLRVLDIMFGFSHTPDPRKTIFNAGMLLAFAGIFQITFLCFFLLLPVAMVMLRPFHPAEWAVAFMGYFTPYYFLWGVMFVTNSLHPVAGWLHLGFSTSLGIHGRVPWSVIIACVGIFIAAGLYGTQQNMTLSNIYIRRNWTVVMFYFIISLLAGFTTDASVSTSWGILLPAATIIASNGPLFEKSKWFSNFIFYFTLVFVSIVAITAHFGK